MSFDLKDYDYFLPEESIAQYPLQPAHTSKLLSCNITQDWAMQLKDCHTYDLPELLKQWSLLIANNSQIFQARIPLNDATLTTKQWTKKKVKSGEILIVKLILHDSWAIDQAQCIIRWSDDKHFKPWTIIYLSNKHNIHIDTYVKGWILVSLRGITLDELCIQYGEYPLPPYILNWNSKQQKLYKTSFWRNTWSVATPTAWLHFTDTLRKDLHKSGIERQEITLHVGIGTFLPIITSDIRSHKLHNEVIQIHSNLFEKIAQQTTTKQDIITIWTTTTRTIESLPYLYKQLTNDYKNRLSPETRQRRDAISAPIEDNSFVLILSQDSDTIIFESSLYIYPWFHRKISNGMITNFHLPKTSLIVLLAWLIWYKNRQNSYQYALQHNYRFASFWDAMLIHFNC